MTRRTLTLFLFFVVPTTGLAVACDDDRVLTDAGPVRADAGPPTDAGSTPDAGNPPLDSGPLPDAGGASTGAIQGVVTRTAAPAAGGVGNLYIAAFTTDPVLDRTGAVNVGNALLENVDMSDMSTSVPYTITGIPTRAEPYFITAFLDDNMSVTDPSAAAPDRGDLVALNGISSPTVAVPTPAPVRLDLVLNFNLPF